MSFGFNVWISPLALPKIMLSTFKHRSRAGILVDILDTLKEPPKRKTKTQIMQSARLNYVQVNKFVNVLTLCDLIRAEPFDYGKRKTIYYTLTHRGSEVLEMLQKLQFTLLLKYKAI